VLSIIRIKMLSKTFRRELKLFYITRRIKALSLISNPKGIRCINLTMNSLKNTLWMAGSILSKLDFFI
jgi:hypothetical protein